MLYYFDNFSAQEKEARLRKKELAKKQMEESEQRIEDQKKANEKAEGAYYRALNDLPTGVQNIGRQVHRFKNIWDLPKFHLSDLKSEKVIHHSFNEIHVF